jgi:signal transduction histidine kinase/CheY-like chemotaxis protein
MADIARGKRVEEELAARTRQLEAVGAVTDEIKKELDLSVVLQLIQRRAMDLLGGGAGVLYLWEDRSQTLRPVAWTAYGDSMATTRLRMGEGVVGTVAERRAGMIINDYRSSPLALPFVLAREDITAAVAEPLMYGEALLGVIVVNNDRTKRIFSQDDQKLLRLFANQAAIAIENARLFGQVKQRNDELQALLTVTTTVSRSLDIAAIAQAAVRATVEVLRVEAGRLYILDEQGQVLRLVAHHGFPPDAVDTYASYAPGQGIIGRIFQTAEPICFADLGSDPRYEAMARSRLGIRLGFHSAAGLPILVQGRPVGVIYVFGRAVRRFPPEELALLAAIGGQVGVAIENARLHAAVRGHAQELEARVRQRTAELERALQVKADFLARMSHELRTPLNFVLGFAELLRNGTAGALTAKQAQFVERIRSGGKQLLELITGILDLTESSTGGRRLRLESVPLASLVREAVERVAVQAAQKQLTLHQEVDPRITVVADRHKLLQMLRMLLSNATKFTPSGGQVSVRARAMEWKSQGETPGVEIAVQDTGIGIAAADLERVFRGFEQGDSSPTRAYPGAGIGLALVRTLAELHGGRVWAESAGPGQGTTLVVQLPPQTPPPAPRVLVVAGQDVFLRALALLLEDAGYRLETMSTAEAALAHLAAGPPPDLLVLDLGLPDLDGLEVLRRVRAVSETSALAVLVLARPGEAIPDEAKVLGAEEFLAQPSSPGLVASMARDILERQAAR